MENEEVAQVEQIKIPGCITDNPGFQAVCLNQWVLQAAWNQYRQENGTRAYEGPEHKNKRHVAYRQMVRWCWGVLGKDIIIIIIIIITLFKHGILIRTNYKNLTY